RFVPCPFGAPGGRMYRVMDRVRRRADGEIEYRGRTDFQVKVRGFRIELGEIESRLVEHPAVRAAVVLAREDAPGDRRLVAYVAADETASVDSLRAHLTERLPAYMVPAAYVRLDALPLTPNGKVDRKALPAPESEAFGARGYEAPAGATEQAVAAIWAELLCVEQVGRGDDFFALGGHSLLGVRVISRVRQALGMEAAPGDLFERPVLADFARGLQTAARSVETAIAPVDRTGAIPPSFAQQRLWFLEQMGDLGGTYHIPIALRLRGGLDRGALVRALDGIVARHEALRTVFPAVQGEPVQHVIPVAEGAFRLVEHDLSAFADAEDALRRLMRDEAAAPFDLARGPLIRGRLVRMADDDHVLLVTMHHIVSDGWSMGILVRELGALYAAFARGAADPLAPLPIQYADYAAWQRRWVSGELLERQAGYWVRTLSGAPELLELPTDRTRPRKQDFAGASLPIELNEALTAELKALSRRHGTTLFMTLLAGWAAVLGRLSGQAEVVVGTPTANRGRSETEALVGFFVNTLALRVDLSGAPTVAELLGRVRTRALEAQQHPDIPFEQVVERVAPARSIAHTPLFQVMFAWQNTPDEALDFAGLRLVQEPGTAPENARFDLTLELWERDGRIGGTIEYATALFDRTTVERHAAYLRRALHEMAADEHRPVDRLALLPADERALVLEGWNRTEADYPATFVHELFRAQAARTPDAVALAWQGERLTYGELSRRANRISHALRRRGAGPEVCVGICLPRTPDLVASMLGVLGAGAAYVPLDPAYPRERLGYMVEDAGLALVITDSTLAERLPEGLATLRLDGEGAALAAESDDAPEARVLPENLSHVIFTSGSTGRPKGVMIRHSAVGVLLHWLRANVADDERASVMFSTSVNFDVSVAEIFGTLCWGGTLVMVENALDLPSIADQRIQYVSMVPTAAAELLRTGGIPASVRTVNLGGEAVPNELAQALYALGTVEKVRNLYGPTEDTTYSTCSLVARGGDRVLIGAPLSNSQAYVLDGELQPVPVGAAGELYLAGDGLARGYANRPGMTAERFLPCPFGAPGGRMYRVMDRVRRRVDANGELEYLGRTDFQVKVRGFRIELGEIESRLVEHPRVHAAVVVARQDTPGDTRLVAYVAADETVSVDALRAHLGERVPAYMVPAAYVRMDALPQTPNGKVDRKALPAPDADSFGVRGYEAPVGETEQAVAAIWAELLGMERVGRGDDFFHLGGHSLLGVRVVSRVRQALGVEAAPGDLFERPVLADFARGLQTAARARSTAIVPVDRGAPIPPSFAQQRLWFLEQMGSLGSTYHIPVRLHLRGELDRDALVRALDRIVARHESLRTTFATLDGEPVQHLASAAGSVFALVEHDLRGSADADDALHRLTRDEMAAPFDLARGPLIRGRLVRMAEDDHVLLVTMHHIVSDGWSMGVFVRELGALYAAFTRGEADPLAPLPIQYADYAAWHRRSVEGDVLEAQAAYWTQTLAGAPELIELPVDRPRPPRQDFAGASLDVELDEALSDSLRALSQRHGTTLYMTLLAGWAAVLARLSGQDDVVIGTPSANRGRAEVEELIGFFVNTLPVRVDLSDSPDVGQLLEQVRTRALEAQRNQDIPFEQVVERLRPARTLAYSPLFQVMFAWQNAPGGDLHLPGLTVADAPAADADSAKFDLTLSLWERDGRITGTLEYATALFDGATAERFAEYLRRVLAGMAADDAARVDGIAILPAAERARVVEAWNATDAAFPADLCIHQLFEAQAARTPDAAAVSHDAERVTYAELNARANRLAHHLRRRGVGPEVRAALCMERGVEMVVSMLAILKAGGAWVPLDPAHPAERLERMLADSGAAVLLTQDRLRARLTATGGIDVLRVDAERAAIAAESADNPRSGATPGGLAYVIYTSGSTGTPKGVGIEHRALVNHMAWFIRDFGLAETDRVLQKTPVVFDASVWEFHAPLLVGGELVMARHEGERDPRYLARTVRDRGITVLQLVPSLLRVLLDEPELAECTALRHLFCGGEPLPGELVRRAAQVLPGVHITNLYGPAECAIDATMHPCTERDGGRAVVSIGRPVSNTRTYVLDGALRPVPVGVPGELFIGGVQVGRGYLGRAALTAEKFVPDPFGVEPGARLYRTGDRVRWTARAELEFLGRTDFQVKIRGMRIELGEIEAALRDHDAVRDAIVLARADAPGEKRLVAYVVGDADADVLRAHLAARVPAYMVPAAYVRLDALPLTPNGKLDRKALPAPEGDAFAARGYEAPVGETEQAVAAIWAELLGVAQVGRGDDFFHLGGHSLLAVRVISRVRQALDVDVAPGDLFERPVLADFARGLQTAARAAATAIAPVDRTGTIPPSFAQQRLWFLEQMGNLGSTYHIPVRLRLRGALDRDALVRALDRIVARHEVLRTTFPTLDGEPIQHVAPAGESAFPLVEDDLRGSADADDALHRLMRDEVAATFDLAHGPLIRGRLVRMAEDDHVLLLTMHHIVSDGWSAGVLHRELGALYAAFTRGEADPLPPLAMQYADYAAWHRRSVEGEVLEAQAAYWTRTLAGAPELIELPVDRPRPARQDFAGASLDVELDEGLSDSLRALSQRHGTTLFMTLLAGWAAVLARLSGQDDVVIGTPSANRGRAEVEELIGFFVNTLPVRVDLSDGPDVGGLLEQVRMRALEAQRNQDIPFEQVVERLRPTRSLAYSPLFQVMFAWQNAPGGDLHLPGLTVADLAAADADTAKFDLSLALWEQDGRIVGAVEYATALFDRPTVERFAGYLRRVLAGMAADGDGRVDAIPMLPAAERRLLLDEWAAGDEVDASATTLPALFQAQVARTPGAVALEHAGERLTYAELDARANRLAHRLAAHGVAAHGVAAHGVARGDTVGVCLEWRPELVVALLATLKAGGVYVPLDPSLPSGRLRYITEDAGLRAVITRAGLADRLPAETVRIDVDADDSAGRADVAGGAVSPADLAYVIYTSGSTGQPKGVAVEHGPAAAHLSAMARVHAIVPEDRVLQFASAGFDVSLEQLFLPLLTGATLVLRGPDLWSAAEFRTRVRDMGITVANLPPAYWQEVADGAGADALRGLRLLLVGGEALPASAADGHGAGRLVNCYGPTETVITATAFAVAGGAGGATVPIGRPLPGRSVYVLDARGEPVPAGVAGELYIGGALLARGYLGRPGLTADRFVPDPFGAAPGGRLYRTGDRVRWSAAGNLEFLGRTDFQVKIRGFRIELGEIEAGLRSHEGVRDAVVLARTDAPGAARLVAYVAGDAEADALRAHLSARMPAYMVPSAYVRLDALPLTPNGKVDRRALPAPEADAFASRGYEAPAGRVEQAVAAVWAELLRVERVGRGDDFFHLGGHSLLAVRVVSRVRQALGVDVAPGDLFERPVLADFARGLTGAAPAAAAMVPVDRAAPIPLSFAQQRLWFLEQLGGTGAAYHVPLRLRLHGELDRDALVRALDRIVARHESLRTTFPAVDGEPVQRIASAGKSAFRLVEHDLRDSADADGALQRVLADETVAPFDLAAGPLIRGRLVRMGADDHVLVVTMHHVVSDGWSMGVFARELGALYGAFRRGADDPLAALEIQYADYAAWQRRWVSGELLERQANFWESALAGAPELLELPVDHARPSRQDFAGGMVPIRLDAELAAALKALSRRRGTTLFMTLLAGWAAVLGRLAGQADVVIGTPTANRDRRETEELIGFFVNTLAVRVDLSGAPTVADLLAQVRTAALEAQQNQDIPFEQVVERVRPARSLAYSPLFQVMFAWQNAAGALELPGLAVADADAADDTAKFDLSLALWEEGDGITGGLTYATALFDRATVERHAGYLRHALEAMAADEHQSVDRLPLLSEAERRYVIQELNATDRPFPAACVHELFRAQAALTPDAVALVWQGERLTYAELNRRANRISHALQRRGAGPEVCVGICLPRTPDLVAAILGVLGAGAAYVPLDPAYPRERLGYMVEDAGLTLVVTDSNLAERLPEGPAALRLDADSAALAAEPDTAPETGVIPENLSHVIFTSGSTGRPKGVMIRHSAVAVLLHWLRENVSDDERASVMFSTSVNFDVSIAELFGTLCWGGTLVMVENALDLPSVADQRIQYVGMVPTAAAELLRTGGIPASVRTVNLAGEALPNELAQALYALGTVEKVRNLYGPTEDTTYSTYSVVERGGDRVLIGTPLSNSQAYVLDGELQPVPVGVAGELYLAGDGLARGYASRPGMTAERFLPCPFGEPGGRMYRVMDRVRRRADANGELEYLGRTDFQVKVRGFRIELGEIESRLVEHPEVHSAVVVAREDTPGDMRLVAYVAADDTVTVDALRAHLTDRVPAYMVPAAYVRLDALPQTPNGKVDRKALPAPEADAFGVGGYEAPVGFMEETVAQIWAEVLNAERVGRGDDFFGLGGHSLLAVRLISRVRQALGAEVSLSDLFERPVLADFARGLETAAGARALAIVPVDRGGPIPPSFAQQRLWFLEQLDGMGGTYHIPMSLRLRGELDRDALVRALDRIVARHESLRTTFPAVDGEPVQRIASIEESAFRLVEHDLQASPDAEDALHRLMDEEAGAPFDLVNGPLVRGRLIWMAADDHVLLVTMHHIVSDGWSMGVFARELGALYGAFARGESDPLPPLAVQYADYAAWQRRSVDGELLERQASFWEHALAGAPELLELPTDRARPRKQEFAGASLPIELDAELTASLKALSRRHGTTLFMTLLAGWAAVLSRLAGQADVVVGTPTAGRERAETEDLIGFFVQTLAVRVDLTGAPTVAELLGRVRTAALQAQQNQDIPFEQVVERVRPARSLAYSPLFQVLFAWQNALGEPFALPGLDTGDAAEAALDTAKFDLSLALWEQDGRITGGLNYATALFDRSTVERHVAYLRLALEEMAADENRPVERLILLPAEERALVLDEWNRTEADYPAACVHELFREQAARTPDAVALVWQGERLTYGELSRRANRISHALRRRGAGPEVCVGICLPRTPDLVAAILGVLGAGAAYVPLDPAYPRERLGYMVEDAAIGLVITDASLADRLPEDAAGRLLLDREYTALAAEPDDAPETGVSPENLSHVIFTSGSTGRPKGVMIRHSAVAVLLHWLRENVSDDERASVMFSTSVNFDVSIAELFGTLCWGGTLVMVENALDLPSVADQRIQYVGMVPTAAAELLRTGGIPASVRTVNLAGEALPNELAQALYALGTVEKVRNLYGPTEDTTYSTYSLVEKGGDRVLIGTPLSNSQAYVLDGELQPVPVGAAGELYLAGDGLARGYASRPGMTAERFLPCPFGEPGGRMYRVMDRVRRRADANGELEYLGRTDFQVKVRGFRIELGEIESRLVEHPEVHSAVVIAREDTPGDTRLVAYVAADDTVTVDALRAHLTERLPAYMVPSAYVRLDALPQTPNGKVDRKALPSPDADAFGVGGYEAPVGFMEETVAQIWAEVLNAERVGRGDDFFGLGGHSLLAVRLISRVRQALGAEVSLSDLFERPVLADFARGLETAAGARALAIVPVDRGGPIPPSFAQQRLWFLEQLDDMGATYHIPMSLRLRGALDRDALVRALDRIVARHESLRTTFPAVDGEPVQRIASIEESAFRLVEHDAHGSEDTLHRLMDEEAGAAFDLVNGPLVRGRLIRMAADDHVLLVTMHHIVSDGWSMGVFARELGALYGAFAHGESDPLPPLAVQYADYAAWQRRSVDGELLERQASFWEHALAGAPELLELPTDRVRPRKQEFAGASLPIELDAELTAALKALSRRHGTTLFMTLLAGWAAVLSRLAGQADVVVGTPTAGRERAETEDLIGFFVQTLAVRVDLTGAPTVAELLGRVRTAALQAQQNQDIPFEQVVERVRPARSLAYSPLFQVLFAWQNALGEPFALPGLDTGDAAEAALDTAKFDLSLALWEQDGRIAGGLNYATALFDRSTVERHAAYLRLALEEMAADENRPVERLTLLPAAERALVLDEWNRTAADYPAECIHELFRKQAAKTPDAVALVWQGERLTYGELSRRANRISHALRRRGAGPEVCVGICLPRTPDLVAAILGVLGAGAAYVPLDPAYPRERLGYMVEDAAIALVITDASLADRLPEDAAGRLLLDREYTALAAEPDTAPETGVVPENLSHVIFTSGSTGRPKGVMIRHSAVAVLLHWLRANVSDDERASVMFSTSVNFDVSIAELFGTLCWGGTLVMVENALDLPSVADQRIQYVGMVPTAAAELLRTGGIPASVRTVNLAGEALPNELAQALYALGTVEKVRNLYGPTEDTTYSTYSLVEKGGDRVLIGTPLSNSQAYVLDGQLQPVPVGAAGELYLAGDGLARGYASRPGMTAERFLPCPFGEPGGRMYRVMDRVRRRADANGELEYLGRTDFQVKVRGFRIELGEIESRLVEHPEVHSAVVVAREDTPGDTRLVAYVAADDTVSVDILRAHLAERLPEYMVPAAYVRLEVLPQTPNGKVDRNALPAPADDAYARHGFEAPVGETEQALAEIWAEVLGLEQVGRWDDFFDLGGHSLLAARVASRLSERFQTQISATTLFLHATLAGLAQAVDEARASQSAQPAIDDGLLDGAMNLDASSVDMLSDDDVDAMLAALLAREMDP
ncbi:amino acid adenylation domain-containing protein, partial [Longimicrobium terrae]